MPTYQYACTACDERLEAVQSFTDAPLTECPACGGRLRKVFSAVGVVFKGSGFYKTDSRSTSGSSDAKTETKADSGSGDKAAATTSGGSGDKGSSTGSSTGSSKGSSTGSSSSASSAPAPSAPASKTA